MKKINRITNRSTFDFKREKFVNEEARLLESWFKADDFISRLGSVLHNAVNFGRRQGYAMAKKGIKP